MMAPEKIIDQRIYGAAFGFNIASLDKPDEVVEGKFGQTKRDRVL